MYELFWGDLHSHCSISYGHGTVEQALMRARQQLDFCSVTGHAFWPDVPTDRDTYAEIIGFYGMGSRFTLSATGRSCCNCKARHQEDDFVAFPQLRMASLEFG